MLLILLLLLLGTVLPRPFFAGDVSGGAAGREILLLSNPIHTDIALPVDDDLRRAFAELQEGGIAVNHPAAAYLVFGWGGRSFYTETPTWADLKPMPVLRSLTLDRSVMHVDVTGDFAADLAGVKRLRISEANGRFNALVGCNTWSAAMLREAGIRTGWWTPLPPFLRWSVALHN